MARAGIAAPVLLALALAACAGGTQAPAAPVKSALSDDAQASDIAALRWLGKGSDRVAFLTTQPVECGDRPSGAAAALAVDLGRVAFESPVLLGGAAARRGISCSSCHISGRGNPDFFVEGVSGNAGTADVTSSLFSKTRGDGAFNPKVIPDLAARDGTQIRDRKGDAFRAKVHGLIVDEFDGQEPRAAVFEDVRAYLDTLDIGGCLNPAAREPVSVLRDLGSASVAAVGASKANEPAEAEFWLRVARRRLERIDERFIGPDLVEARARIARLSQRLGDQADAIHAGQTPKAAFDAVDWLALRMAVIAGEPKSLYNPAVLKAALATSTHPPGVR